MRGLFQIPEDLNGGLTPGLVPLTSGSVMRGELASGHWALLVGGQPGVSLICWPLGPLAAATLQVGRLPSTARILGPAVGFVDSHLCSFLLAAACQAVSLQHSSSTPGAMGKPASLRLRASTAELAVGLCS